MKQTPRFLLPRWIVVLALPSSAFGQVVTVGGKLGVTSAIIDVSGFEGEVTRTGFVAGGGLGIELHRAFAIQLEALYAQKGAQASDDDETERIWLAYLEVPVLAEVWVPIPNLPVRPVFYAGPTVAFEVSKAATPAASPTSPTKRRPR